MPKVRIDSSKVRGLADKLKSAKDRLETGWFEGSKYDEGLPVAMVAYWQEMGTKTAPARKFFRPAIEDNQQKWRDAFYFYARKWINGMGSYSQVLTAVGLTVEADVRNAIVDGNHAALSPVTLALRRLRDDNVPIGGKVVGQVAAAVAEGKTGSGELGQPSANRDPLRETGYMISTLTHEVTSE